MSTFFGHLLQAKGTGGGEKGRRSNASTFAVIAVKNRWTKVTKFFGNFRRKFGKKKQNFKEISTKFSINIYISSNFEQIAAIFEDSFGGFSVFSTLSFSAIPQKPKPSTLTSPKRPTQLHLPGYHHKNWAFHIELPNRPRRPKPHHHLRLISPSRSIFSHFSGTHRRRWPIQNRAGERPSRSKDVVFGFRRVGRDWDTTGP